MEPAETEPPRKRVVEEAVIAVMKAVDLEEATELKVRTMVARRLCIDLSDLQPKRLVRRVVESYLLSMQDQLKPERRTHVAVPAQAQGVAPSEPTQDGGRMWKLAETRGVAVHDFKGSTLVSIRDYYEKDGKLLHSSRGISLSSWQWSAFRKSFPSIEAAILKMESRIRSKDAGKRVDADMPNLVSAVAQGIIPPATQQIETDISSSVAASASEGLKPIQTTRLDGKNYHVWARQMVLFLQQLKIAYVLTQPCPRISPEASVEEVAQAKAAVQKWVDDDYICRHSILSSVCDHLFEQYSKRIFSAKELWEDIKLAYDDDFGTKRSQVSKYMRFQMVDGISVIEQVEELHSIANSLIASGMGIDENFHVSVIISKLPPSWKDYSKKLMQEEFLPLNVLIHRLSVEEESRHRANKEGRFVKAHVGEPRAENKLGQKKDSKAIICYNCGKTGHISRNCHQRKVVHKRDEANVEAPAVAEAGGMVDPGKGTTHSCSSSKAEQQLAQEKPRGS
ncbi:uncharacterized protein LOC127814252 [Diospyros lotus]|uniref:uncharacterized protein LOC127814252 n=1 Tax=Diospyros lotus TaxID=55363 RepID=UPI00225A386C|nr:uncharacterized protein LOC127814252 [Diospyros lotus]